MDVTNWLFGNVQSNTDQSHEGYGTQPPRHSDFQGTSTWLYSDNTHHEHNIRPHPNCVDYGEGTSQPSRHSMYEEGTSRQNYFTSLLTEGMQGVPQQNFEFYEDLHESSEVQQNISEVENEENEEQIYEEVENMIIDSSEVRDKCLKGVQKKAKAKSWLYFKFVKDHLTPRRKKPVPYHTDPTPGYVWLHNVLSCEHPKRATDVFGMTSQVFMMLHDELIASYGWQEPQNADGIRLREALGMFLCLLRGWKNHGLLERFNRPKSTLSEQLKKILPCFEKFAFDWVTPEVEDQQYIHPYLDRRRMYHHFEVNVVCCLSRLILSVGQFLNNCPCNIYFR